MNGKTALQLSEQKNRRKCLAEDRRLSVRMLQELTGISREAARIILGLSFESLAPGPFFTTVDQRIRWTMSPGFWPNEGYPYYPIYPAGSLVGWSWVTFFIS
jgi:hypothetical protein